MHAALLVCYVFIGRAVHLDRPSDFDIGCYDEEDKGKSYKGLVTKASSGRTCQNWLVNHPHEITHIEPMPANGIGNHNYCRNPDESEGKPWCFTLDPSPDHKKETCNVPICPETRDFSSEAKFLASKMPPIGPIQVNLGPLSVGSGGVKVKPQFEVGVLMNNAKASAGIGDVRDGLKVSALASAYVEAKAKGHNVFELHKSIHCKEPGFHEALEIAKKLLETGLRGADSALVEIADAVGETPASMESVLVGESNTSGESAKLRVMASVDVGVSAEVRLGWCDTKGYNMVGAGGEVAQGMRMGASVFAGKHASGKLVKIILAISNFQFEYTFPIG